MQLLELANANAHDFFYAYLYVGLYYESQVRGVRFFSFQCCIDFLVRLKPLVIVECNMNNLLSVCEYSVQFLLY